MSQNSTAHWSIGEVLSLLQEEFPEVTISKIRFLESQGLIDPERTPSGYRRFYDHDFDRLRWILVQQRDHYLPLKVIRDRLELSDSLGAPQLESGDDIEIVEPSDIVEPLDTTEGQVVAKDVTTVPLLDLTDDAAVPAESLVLPVPEVEQVTLVSNRKAEPQPEVEAVSAVQKQSAATPTATSAANPAMSREELAEAAGCDTRLLHELERFSLITGRTAANGLVFDQHDLDVARTAVAFGERGLDPRHLRIFRLSAEREVGLVAQIVEPMLHRRSPGARQETYEALADMMNLATTLHDAMVQQVVEEQFPER